MDRRQRNAMIRSTPPRTELLRRQGQLESGFALLSAVLLLGSSASPGLVAAMGALAVWMALRGRRMVEQALPLTDAQRAELQRLATDSKPVRELLALLERAGQQPVLYDLERCRRLARVTALIDGRA
jgi:hypothetical protein